MSIMGNFYSSLKGFRNVPLILWLVVWKAYETETQYISQVLDQLQLSSPLQQEDCGNPLPHTSRKLRTTINRRKLGFSPRKKTSTFEKGGGKIIVQKVLTQPTQDVNLAASIRRACHAKNENDSDEIKLTAATKKKGARALSEQPSHVQPSGGEQVSLVLPHTLLKASFNLSMVW